MGVFNKTFMLLLCSSYIFNSVKHIFYVIWMLLTQEHTHFVPNSYLILYFFLLLLLLLLFHLIFSCYKGQVHSNIKLCNEKKERNEENNNNHVKT